MSDAGRGAGTSGDGGAVLKRDEHGCWYALTDHPQQKMEQAPQEPQML